MTARRRTVALLCLLSALLGAAAMLIGLNARHEYGLKQALAVAEERVNARPIDIHGPPPPSAIQLAQARPACESLSRLSRLSPDELAEAASLVRRPAAMHVDEDRLRGAFGGLDRLRIALFGLSRQDRDRALESVRHDPVARPYYARLEVQLSEALRACADLRGYRPSGI
jgi:hypothetical protein